MKGRWTIGRKLMFSFLLVASVAALLGGVGYYSTAKSDQAIDEVGKIRLPSVEAALTMRAAAGHIRGSMRALAIPGLDKDLRQEEYAVIDGSRKSYQEAWKIYEPLPQTPEEAEIWKRFVPAWEAWEAENSKAVDLSRRFDSLGIANPEALKRDLEKFRGDHYRLETMVLEMLQTGEVFEGGEDHTVCNCGRWLASFRTDNPDLQQAVTALVAPHQHFHEQVHEIKELMNGGRPVEARALAFGDFMAAQEEVFSGFEKVLAIAEEAEAAMVGLRDQLLGPVEEKQRTALSLLDDIVEINSRVAAETVVVAARDSKRMKFLMSVLAVSGVAAAMLLGLIITRSINGVLRTSAEGLNECAAQVASAAGQVSSAGQSLAEGASEQAAGIEETSSSIEEMASMTRQNAENAAQADSLMKQAAQSAEGAKASMTELLQSMVDINRSSEETQKIIKTIDEIAFQTNLLALNAAVEAARAGEAGAGFAVVADEVRNLAMRAAEAARNTAQLIEGTVARVKQGGALTESTNEAFTTVHENVNRVAELVNEIAAASREQSEGIGQVNNAISEMDKVVQQNAASAEESASAAEELNAQAEQMQTMVEELLALVGRRGGGVETERSPAGEIRAKRAPSAPKRQDPAPAKRPGNGKARHDRMTLPTDRPEEVIPFDEGDFKDF